MRDTAAAGWCAMRWAAVLLLVLFAGCLAPEPPPAQPSPCGAGEICACDDCGGCDAADSVPCPSPAVPGARPHLTPGRSWTYTADGLYDIDTEFTVVVARSDADGVLLAGQTEECIKGAAVWGRVWMGERDGELNEEGYRMFDWPLADGKSWKLTDAIEVTARAANISVPGGTAPGFVISGGAEGSTVEYEYADSIGYLVRFRSARGDVAYADIELKESGPSESWLWFERGPRAFAGGEQPAAVLQVPDGYDSVVASAGGASGGKARLVPPPTAGEPWAYDADGAEAWVGTVREATAGPWTLAATSPPGGFGWLEAVAVKWVRSED